MLVVPPFRWPHELTVRCRAVLFNYTILRDTKDVLVVTAPGSGAEIIPFLKVRQRCAAEAVATLIADHSRSLCRPGSSKSSLFPRARQ